MSIVPFIHTTGITGQIYFRFSNVTVDFLAETSKALRKATVKLSKCNFWLVIAVI